VLVIILFLLLGKEASGAPTKDVYTSRLASSVVAPTYSIIKTTQIPDTKKIPSVRAYRGNCYRTVKNAGYDLPRTIDGYARTIPAVSRPIAEGEEVVLKTAESSLGHVLVAKKVDGQLVSVVEGGHSLGVGRVVDPSLVLGVVE